MATHGCDTDVVFIRVFVWREACREGTGQTGLGNRKSKQLAQLLEGSYPSMFDVT